VSWSTGRFTVVPRGVVWLWFSWNGEDKGPQWAIPHPLPGQPPARLSVSEFSKIIEYEIAGRILHTGERVYRPEHARYAYYLLVTNHSDDTVTFSLQGGRAD
jgi:hypothetical protein